MKRITKILASALALLTLLIIATSLYPVSASNSTWPLPRHTTGFPTIINKSLEKILEEHPSKYATSSATPSVNTIHISKSYDTTRVIEAVSRNLGVSPSYLESILKSINDVEAKREFLELLKAYAQGAINENQVINVVKALMEAYAKGKVSPEAYSAALDLINRISRSLGFNYSELYKNALQSIPIPKDLNMNLGSAPSLSIPSLPSMPPLSSAEILEPILIAIAITSITILLILLSRRICIACRYLSSALKRYTEIAIYGPVVRYYWQAVKLIEMNLGIERMANETHREFLSKVRERIGRSLKPFEELTQLYELARFGGVEDKSLEDRARKCLEAVRQCLASVRS